MKNKFEDWCYVCGELVTEGAGLAEQHDRKPGTTGWGKTKWVVRHTTCQPSETEQSPLSGAKTEK